jgi:hypothetical protein
MADAKSVGRRAAMLRRRLVDHGGSATVKAQIREAGGLLYQRCNCVHCKGWRVELAAMAARNGSTV